MMLARQAWRQRFRFNARRSLFWGAGLLVIGLLFGFGVAIWMPIAWQLGLTAQSETVAIDLWGKTEWDIGSATVCVRPDRAGAVGEGWVPNPICGDSAWYEVANRSGQAGRWLEMPAIADGGMRTLIERRPDGSAIMILRADLAQQARPLLHSHEEASGTAQALPARVNVVWQPAAQEVLADFMVLPFTGNTIVGRDVTWGRRLLLTEGKISVFAASDEALAGRVLAEEATLFMGDQVRLNMHTDERAYTVWPKGFVRFNTIKTDQPQALAVVAFAAAEGVSIQRYGSGDYGFKPGWWPRIKHKSTLLIVLVLLTGGLSIVAALANILAILPLLQQWRAARRHSRIS
ncbi:hypothetical protein H0A66_05600 [Alcaligenaceae bacterium]|nr:hypothetical protein [Alcaligenaceae bacterium]